MDHMDHEFQGRCHHCKRNMVWIVLLANPARFVYRDHSYVVGFGTPSQKLIKCAMSGEKALGLGLD